MAHVTDQLLAGIVIDRVVDVYRGEKCPDDPAMRGEVLQALSDFARAVLFSDHVSYDCGAYTLSNVVHKIVDHVHNGAGCRDVLVSKACVRKLEDIVLADGYEARMRGLLALLPDAVDCAPAAWRAFVLREVAKYLDSGKDYGITSNTRDIIEPMLALIDAKVINTMVGWVEQDVVRQRVSIADHTKIDTFLRTALHCHVLISLYYQAFRHEFFVPDDGSVDNPAAALSLCDCRTRQTLVQAGAAPPSSGVYVYEVVGNVMLPHALARVVDESTKPSQFFVVLGQLRGEFARVRQAIGAWHNAIDQRNPQALREAEGMLHEYMDAFSRREREITTVARASNSLSVGVSAGLGSLNIGLGGCRRQMLHWVFPPARLAEATVGSSRADADERLRTRVTSIFAESLG